MAKHKTILNVAQEIARRLHDVGLMEAKTMRDFDELCLPRIKECTAAQIKRIRERNKASQPFFADNLNTSVSTVLKWGRGEKRPNCPSLKLLGLIETKGLHVLAS